jgi:hypothetical protein
MARAENREVHPQEELMARRTERQQSLAFASAGHWEQVPARRQEECRKLLSQLLRAVVLAECAARRKRDE